MKWEPLPEGRFLGAHVLTEQRGAYRVIEKPKPATVATGYTYTCPAGYLALVSLFFVQYHTVLAAQKRTYVTRIRSLNRTILRQEQPVTNGENANVFFNIQGSVAPVAPYVIAENLTITVPNVILEPGWRFDAFTEENINTDIWEGGTFIVEEWENNRERREGHEHGEPRRHPYE